MFPLLLIWFSSQNCQMHLCSGTGSTVMWILQSFFQIHPLPQFFGCVFCSCIYSHNFKHQQNKTIAGRMMLITFDREVLKKSCLVDTGVFSATTERWCIRVNTWRGRIFTWNMQIQLNDIIKRIVPPFKNSVQEEAVSWTICDIQTFGNIKMGMKPHWFKICPAVHTLVLYSLSDIRPR